MEEEHLIKGLNYALDMVDKIPYDKQKLMETCHKMYSVQYDEDIPRVICELLMLAAHKDLDIGKEVYQHLLKFYHE